MAVMAKTISTWSTITVKQQNKIMNQHNNISLYNIYLIANRIELLKGKNNKKQTKTHTFENGLRQS